MRAWADIFGVFKNKVINDDKNEIKSDLNKNKTYL